MRRGIVTFCFDDGYTAILRHVVPLLNAYGIRAVFAIPLDAGRMTAETGHAVGSWQEWKKVSEQGHEIAAHSIDHTNLTTLSDHKLHDQLREPVVWLKAKTIVYPGGACDDRVVAAARTYYQAGRTVRRGLEKLPTSDWMRLKTYDYTRHNFNAAVANRRVVWAWLTNRWLIETYHLVTDKDNALTHSVGFSEFKKHLVFVKRLPIDVMTISAVYSKFGVQV